MATAGFERGLALCSVNVIQTEDLQLSPADIAVPADVSGVPGKYPLTDYLDKVEREVILEALNQTGFNRTAAAKILGVTFRALRYRMARLDITGSTDAEN